MVDHAIIPINSRSIAEGVAPSVITLRIAFAKKVSGRYAETDFNQPGIVDTEKKMLPTNNMGKTTIFASNGALSTFLESPETVKPRPRNIRAPRITQIAISQ